MATLFESFRESKALCTHRGAVTTLPLQQPFSSQSHMEQIAMWWELLCAIATWMIWKSRCQKVSKGKGNPTSADNKGNMVGNYFHMEGSN
jgi:hypothetical protein